MTEVTAPLFIDITVFVSLLLTFFLLLSILLLTLLFSVFVYMLTNVVVIIFCLTLWLSVISSSFLRLTISCVLFVYLVVRRK